MATNCDWLTHFGVGQGGLVRGRRAGSPFFAGKVDRRFVPARRTTTVLVRSARTRDLVK